MAVNEPERRNAEFTGEFSGYVKDIARAVRPLLAEGVLSEREIVRMADQSLVAEIVGFHERGVSDGAEKDITRIYESHRNFDPTALPDGAAVVSLIELAHRYLQPLAKETICKRPHFLMLVAALMKIQGTLPAGKIAWLETSEETTSAPLEVAIEELNRLNEALMSAEAATQLDLTEFRDARSNTHRMKSREVRLRYILAAISQQA